MAPVPARIEWPEMSSTDQVHVALFTPGYPYVGAAMRAVELSRRPGAAFSWRVGEPLSPLRDTFARSLLETEATHALMLEGDVVPPPDVVDRLMQADAPVVTAAYPQWVDERLSANVQALVDTSWSDTIPTRVFPVRRCLLGCILVRRDVFTTVPPPWFLSTMTEDRFVTDDEWFCRAVRHARLSIVCDGSVTCASIWHGSNLLALTGGSIHQT